MISLLDILRRIDAGDATPQDAIRAAHDAIGRADDAIRAFVHVDASARAGAEGPLRGIAVGVKDIIDTADMPTEMGSPIYAGWRPKADAPIVTALARAGATPIGKTATTPFAHLDPTPTRNPRNPGHTPGGSSSGSAAAVGAGMVPLALGTQTGGSIIRPASFCGCAAIKPSYRLIPTVGVKCFSWGLDTVGMFAATVPDVAYALAAVTGRADFRIDGNAPPAPRIGVVTQDFAGTLEAGSVEALHVAQQAAERAGATVRPLAMPEIFAKAWHIHTTVQQFEAHQSFAWEYRERYAEMAPLLRGRLDESRDIPPADYDEAQRIAARARAALADIFAEVDVILTVSAPGAPPKGLDSTGDPTFNRLWTLLGTPCVNVPAIVADGNLPVGVQVIAGIGNDAKALAAARFVEQALKG
ncbi:MAG: amidase [Microvirga sp.]